MKCRAIANSALAEGAHIFTNKEVRILGSTAVHGKILLVTNASCFLAMLEDSWI